MRFRLFNLVLLLGLCQTQALRAEEPKVSIAGLQVVRFAKTDTSGNVYNRNALVPFNNATAGTRIALLVEVKESNLVRLDSEQSSIDILEDDTGANLLNKVPAATTKVFIANPFGNPFGSRSSTGGLTDLRLGKDGKRGLLEVTSNVAPTQGSVEIALSGTLGVVVASETETVRTEPVAVDATEVKVGDVTFAMKPRKSGSSFTLELTSSDPKLSHLRQAQFFADGAQLELRSNYVQNLGKGNLKHRYHFARAPEKEIIMEFEFWSDARVVQVPLEMQIGIGG